jgi:hypothetical protein
MTAVIDTPTNQPSDPGERIVLLARVGSERIALTAVQVRDTVASYLATGGHLPIPRSGDGTDPYQPLHVITEQWLWSNPTGWVHRADRVQLALHRGAAMDWIRGFFGPSFPDLDH